MRIFFLLFLSLLGQAFTTQGTFSPIKTLPTSYIDESVFSYCSYNSKNNNVFMTWIDNDDYPWFTIYSPNSGVFDTYPSKIVDQEIYLNPPISCYNRKDNTIFLTWTGFDKSVNIAIYDCDAQIFSLPPQSILAKANFNTYCCYNPHDNTVFLSWALDGSQPHPMYAIYDCTQKAFSIAPTLLSDYFKAHIDVTCCYNPKNNTVFLTWADDYDSEYNPYFAIYDCTNNQIVVNPTQIDKDKYTRGVKYDVFATPVEKENLIFLSWSEKKADGEPIYAVYDWLNDKFIVDPTGIESEIFEFPQLDVYPCYDPIKNTVLLSWSGNFGNFYAIYDCREKKFSQTSSLIPNTQNDQHLSRVNVISVFLEKNPSIFISWATKYTISFTTYYDSKTALKYLFKKSPVDFQKGN